MTVHLIWPSLIGAFFLIVSFQNCTSNKWNSGTIGLSMSSSTAVVENRAPELFTPLSGTNNLASTRCSANDTETWKICSSKITDGSIDTIEVNGQINCSDSTCSLQVQNKKTVSILGLSNAKFYRSAGFDKPLLAFYQVENVVISNIDFYDIENVAYKAKSGDQEINSLCLSYSDQKCEPIVSIQSTTQVEIRKSKFLNGKIFGIALANNDKVFISDSLVQNSWWFGIWGKNNRLLEFSNNQFLNNRSNAFLMSFEKSEKTLIKDNYFSGNHHATAFHVCGTGSEPCPGGQIDLIEQVNNVEITNNTFVNGRLSLEFPEDKNHNWISAIEFEPHDKNISNVKIHNNTISNNSGSEFYLNLPTGDQNRQLLNGFSFYNNTLCNNTTQGATFGSTFRWGSQVNSYGNTICDETPEPPRTQKPLVTSAGLGCSQNECIWIQGSDFSANCTVDIYKADWSKLITKITNPICQSNVITFKIPPEVLSSEISINFSVVNETGLWSAPYNLKIKP